MDSAIGPDFFVVPHFALVTFGGGFATPSSTPESRSWSRYRDDSAVLDNYCSVYTGPALSPAVKKSTVSNLGCLRSTVLLVYFGSVVLHIRRLRSRKIVVSRAPFPVTLRWKEVIRYDSQSYLDLGRHPGDQRSDLDLDTVSSVLKSYLFIKIWVNDEVVINVNKSTLLCIPHIFR